MQTENRRSIYPLKDEDSVPPGQPLLLVAENHESILVGNKSSPKEMRDKKKRGGPAVGMTQGDAY